MSRDARFWRWVTIIALVHIALLIGLIRWSRESKRPGPKEIVWMDAGAGPISEGSSPAASSLPETILPPEEPPAPTPEATPKQEEAEETPLLTAAKSEIELPTASPKPTPNATPTPKPTATPKRTPKPTPKPSPKKKLLAKASPKPTATPKEKADKEEASEKQKKKEIAKLALARKESGESSDKPAGKQTAAEGSKKSGAADGGGEEGTGEGGASEFGWYGNMLHDRFYSEWVQPTTVVASNAKLSALVKIRIEKDGTVSDFKVIKPSGNVVIDESVEAVAKRVTQVDPLPAGLGGNHYDVQVNFELDNQ